MTKENFLDMNTLSNGVRILWFGAHPDDELFVAPLLRRLHSTKRARLHFVVATREERGPCYRPEGCPDLAAVREEEMRNAAAVFGAEAEFLEGCADGSATLRDRVLYHWMRSPPGEQLRSAADRFRPDVVLTLGPDRVWLAETRVHWAERPMHFSSREPDAQESDCAEWWDYLLRDLACHKSQMRESTIEGLASVPENERKIDLLPARQPAG